jgi:hypothetical protein
MDALPSPTAQAAFEYTSLPLSGHHIRLLRIRRTETDIHCELHNYQLSSTLEFKTLSYTWGLKFPQHQISLNDKTFSIRQNLWDFFRIAAIEEGTLFWIDQICIDQSNASERSHQVGFMSEIYKRASEVIVWLGPEADDSDEAMKLLLGPQDVLGRLLEFGNYRREAPPLEKLLGRVYWSRLWIVQEIVLAQKALLCCGTMTAPWSRLQSPFVKMGLTEIDQQKYPFTPALVLAWLSAQAKDGAKGLIRLIHLFRYSKCEEPRDLVYAILGLESEPHRIVVDYSRSRENLFKDTMRHILSTQDSEHLTIGTSVFFTLWKRLECDLYKIEVWSPSTPWGFKYRKCHVRLFLKHC